MGYFPKNVLFQRTFQACMGTYMGGGGDVVCGGVISSVRQRGFPRPPNVEKPGCITKHAKTVNILATTMFLKKIVCSFFGQNIDPGDDCIKLGYN